MPQIRISKIASEKLTDISKKRKDENAIISSKKSVNEELIDKAHNREIKK